MTSRSARASLPTVVPTGDGFTFFCGEAVAAARDAHKNNNRCTRRRSSFSYSANPPPHPPRRRKPDRRRWVVGGGGGDVYSHDTLRLEIPRGGRRVRPPRQYRSVRGPRNTHGPSTTRDRVPRRHCECRVTYVRLSTVRFAVSVTFSPPPSPPLHGHRTTRNMWSYRCVLILGECIVVDSVAARNGCNDVPAAARECGRQTEHVPRVPHFFPFHVILPAEIIAISKYAVISHVKRQFGNSS